MGIAVSRPDDAYSHASSRNRFDPDPTIVIEARSLYQTKGEVLLLDTVFPTSEAPAFRRRGGDVAIIFSWGPIVLEAEGAADELPAPEVSRHPSWTFAGWLCSTTRS